MKPKISKNIEAQIQIALAKPRHQREPGGPGLYRINDDEVLLQVSRTRTRSWAFRYRNDGTTRLKGLGSVRKVSYDDALKKARKLRVLLDDGIDPLAGYDAVKKNKRLPPELMTLRACALEYIETRSADWTNPKHAAQWTASLENHVFPVIGDMLVAEVDSTAVLRFLEPIYYTKNETATRVRGRVELVLGYAMVKNYRAQGPNPATWTGFLSTAFPRRASVRQVKHHAALPYAELPEFMERLRGNTGHCGPLLMRFMILTAARTGEVRGATWREIDIENRVWAIPAERMKARREHRVPLSAPAISVLQEVLSSIAGNRPKPEAHVFPGQRAGRPLSDMVLLRMFDRMGVGQYTPHGTARSGFKDWSSEKTSYPREVTEAALAHQEANRVVAAYARSTLFDLRVPLMDAWGRFCTIASGADEAK